MGLFDPFQRKRHRILHFTVSLKKTKLIFCFEKVCMLSALSLRPSSLSILRHPWMPKEEWEWNNKQKKKRYCGHPHPLQRQMPLPSHVLIFGCFFSGCWWGFGVLKLVAMEVWGGLSSWKPTFAHSVRKTTCRAASKANEEKKETVLTGREVGCLLPNVNGNEQIRGVGQCMEGVFFLTWVHGNERVKVELSRVVEFELVRHA